MMVVGMGDDPSLGEYERLLLSMKTTARKELVLLHPDRFVTPGSTREWLKVTNMISLWQQQLTCVYRIDHGYLHIFMLNYLQVQWPSLRRLTTHPYSEIDYQKTATFSPWTYSPS